MSVDLVLTVVSVLALFAVIVAAALGIAGFHVRVVESDDEVGDDVVAMLAAWRNEATR